MSNTITQIAEIAYAVEAALPDTSTPHWPGQWCDPARAAAKRIHRAAVAAAWQEAAVAIFSELCAQARAGDLAAAQTISAYITWNGAAPKNTDRAEAIDAAREMRDTDLTTSLVWAEIGTQIREAAAGQHKRIALALSGVDPD